MPAGEGVHDIALTPDGTRLAVVIQKTGTQGGVPVVEQEAIEVADLATGVVRTWTIPDVGLLTDLTWDTAGRRVAYFYVGDSPRTIGLWQLDTASTGERAACRPAPAPADRRAWTRCRSALLAPDGQHIIASVILTTRFRTSRDSTVIGGIVQLSAQGQPLQNLLAQRATPPPVPTPPSPAASSRPSTRPASHLLVSCAEEFGRLDHARFTTLPSAGSAERHRLGLVRDPVPAPKRGRPRPRGQRGRGLRAGWPG